MNADEILDRNFSAISDEYRQFATEKDGCKSCSIYGCYKQVGQSEGNALNPTFMFIGEALGADEIEHARPFIGMAGQRLRLELRKHPETFTRGNTLISNVLPCRPSNNNFPKGAGPWTVLKNPKTPIRADAKLLVNHCTGKWLFREIKITRPKVIITLGAVPLEYVRDEKVISAHRGEWKFLDQFQAWSYATYHPSYVVRCERSGDDHIVQNFEEDIARISSSWADLVQGDERVSMTERAWSMKRALNKGVELGLIGGRT